MAGVANSQDGVQVAVMSQLAAQVRCMWYCGMTNGACYSTHVPCTLLEMNAIVGQAYRLWFWDADQHAFGSDMHADLHVHVQY